MCWSTSALPMTSARCFMFYINETLTSVAWSFRSCITGGTMNLIVLSLSMFFETSQMECAKLPLTCWLWSLTVNALMIGKIFSTIAVAEQFLLNSGILPMASDLTSASLSYSNCSYKVKMSSSEICLVSCSANIAAISATANRNLQDYLLSTAFLKAGMISYWMISGCSCNSLATVTELYTAFILTESLSSWSRPFSKGSMYS